MLAPALGWTIIAEEEKFLLRNCLIPQLWFCFCSFLFVLIGFLHGSAGASVDDRCRGGFLSVTCQRKTRRVTIRGRCEIPLKLQS